MYKVTWQHEVKTLENPITLAPVTRHYLSMFRDGQFYMKSIFDEQGNVNVLKPMGFSVQEMAEIALKIREILWRKIIR